MKENYTTQVQVEGKAETKAKAFAAALAQVQGKVLKSTNNVLLRIEPQDVKVLQADEKIINEKFLFFFLPRERRIYKVSLEITINVTMINIDNIDFVTQ